MLRKMNLVSALFAAAVVLLSVGDARALAVFTVGGVKMICQSCTCAEMGDAGVPLEHCVDTALVVQPGAPKVYDKIIRYGAEDVTLHSPRGEEFPLASDAAQKQFDEIAARRDFKRLVGRLRPSAGPISQERVERLAKSLGVEVVDKQDRDGAAEGEQGGPKPVLVTIRDGRLLGLRSFKASERIRLAGDVYKALATPRGGKLVLQFDRPLSRGPKPELRVDAPLNLDRETGSALVACGCQEGTFPVENADTRSPVVTIDVTQRRRGHRWSTRYIVDACPHW